MIPVIFLTLVIHQIYCYFRRQSFDIFDKYLYVDIVIMIMFVLGPVASPEIRIYWEINWKYSLVTYLGILSLYSGLHLPTRTGSPKEYTWKTGRFTKYYFALSILLFVFFTLLATYDNFQFSGRGFWEYFLGERLTDYAELINIEQKNIFNYEVIELSRPIVILSLCFAILQHKKIISLAIYLILVFSILLTFRTRLMVVIILVLPIVIYNYYIKKLTVLKTALFTMFLLCTFIMMTVWRGAGIKALDESAFLPKEMFNSIISNLNPVIGYQKLWSFYEDDLIKHEYGAGYLYLLETIVPRKIWPEKPLVSFEARWTDLLFGSHYAEDLNVQGVWTFTVWGEGLVQFGPIGVLINCFIYGLVMNILFQFFAKYKFFLVLSFYYAVICAVYLRSSMTALVWTIAFTMFPVIVLFRSGEIEVIDGGQKFGLN